MKLPNANSAIVDEAKVRDYLLSPEHPVGRFKARVFVAAGYRRQRWQRLRDDLAALAESLDTELARIDQYGQHFVGTGELRAPGGQALPVVTVWVVPFEGAPPRLVTAYPGQSR